MWIISCGVYADWYLNDPKFSCAPVIIGAPPDSDSPHTHGRRISANGECQWDGLKHQHNITANCTQIKRKKDQPSMSDTISLHDSNEDVTICKKGKGKFGQPPPVSTMLSEDDNIVVVSPPAEDETHKKAKGKSCHMPPVPVVPSEDDNILMISPPAADKKTHHQCKSQHMKAGSKPIQNTGSSSEDEVQDLSSPSGLEYQPEEGKKGNQDHAGGDIPPDAVDSSSLEDKNRTISQMISCKHRTDSNSKLDNHATKKHMVIEIISCALSFKFKGKAKAISISLSQAPSEKLTIGPSNPVTSCHDEGPQKSPLPLTPPCNKTFLSLPQFPLSYPSLSWFLLLHPSLSQFLLPHPSLWLFKLRSKTLLLMLLELKMPASLPPQWCTPNHNLSQRWLARSSIIQLIHSVFIQNPFPWQWEKQWALTILICSVAHLHQWISSQQKKAVPIPPSLEPWL